MGRFRDIVINHLNRIEQGKEMYIPNPHGKMGDIFNIYKGRYILIGSNTGIGKSSFIDDTFLLRPYEWLSKQSFKHHYEVLYYSMERGERDKYVKWLAWKVYSETGVIHSSNKFQNCKQEEAAKYRAISEKYEPWADSLLDKVKLKQGPREVYEIAADIEEAAKRLCYHVKTNDKEIYVDNRKVGEFTNQMKDINGIQTPYRTLNLADETRELIPNMEFWLLKNPNTFLFIVVDHLGKTKKGTEMIQKGAIDRLDEVLANARDKYQFIPIAISQFNRAIGDFGRIKMSKGDLSPIIEDFKDTSNTQESADLILAPFDPYRYDSYDKDGNYKGYNLTPGMLNPSGSCRFRSIHILKNSYGPSDIVYGMKFLGEVSHFSLLPSYDDPDALLKIYQDVMQNK